MNLRLARAGAGLALLYVAVAVCTSVLSSRPVLPLFDGFAPPTPYAWVNPPPDRSADNVAPRRAEREFSLGPEGLAASNVATEDAQAIVGLDAGSVPARAPDTGVVVVVSPEDAGTLGPVPPGLRVASNAYRVEIRYLPSQTPLTRLAVAGTIALTASEPANRLLFSPDGQVWEEREFRPYGENHGLFTELEATGWYLVATSAAPASGDGGGSDLLRGVLLVLAAVVPIVGAVLVLRLPSPVPAAPAPRPGRPSGARRPPAARKRRGDHRR